MDAPKLKVTAINHVVLHVTDLERSKRFYMRIPAVFVHPFWPIPYTDSGGFRTPLRAAQKVVHR